MNSLFWLILVCGFYLVTSNEVQLKCDPFGENICRISNFITKEKINVTSIKSDINLVEEFLFVDSSLDFIPRNIFNLAEHIKTFGAGFCGIKSIEADDFQGAHALKDLCLSHNSIEMIPSSVFSRARNLTRIILSYNQIKELKANDFSGLHALDELHLSHNDIGHIDSEAFSNSPRLWAIDLGYNQLQNIDSKLFKNCHSLHWIKLNNNRLLSIEGETFAHLSGPVILQLESNQLSTLDLQINIDWLDISRNNLTKIILQPQWIWLNGSYNQITEVKTHGNNSFAMTKLDLGNNQITNYDFALKNLEYLNLSNNKLNPLNISTFSNVNNLRELILRNCSLNNITFGTFSSQTTLKIFDISFNNLTHIEFGSFVPYFRNIIEFYIDGNNLTEINSFRKEYFPKLEKIGLSKNHFECTDILKTVHEIDLNQTELIVDSKDSIINKTHVIGIACHEGDTRPGERHDLKKESSESLETLSTGINFHKKFNVYYSCRGISVRMHQICNEI